jgi:Asp-tRNA(Asn)/Glu-tRNA(Gln) amidotransferase A subunit family amidase
LAFVDAVVTDLVQMSAVDAARRIATGEITSEILVTACLDRIAEREETVQAWAYLDRDFALEQARRADALRAVGGSTGPLHGVPVGIKDIIDTEDMPTENGSPVFAGRRPSADAAVVSALRDAGAIIMGKTVTAELAASHPGKTRNPVNPEHTPGGSSSGSAAAVADGMVPLALGTQTAGSVIRPAAYCGVVGFKPSFGLISRTGILSHSPALDTVGTFSRTLKDAALLAECLTGYDARDRDMRPRSRPRLSEIAGQAPPVTPILAYVKSPVWDQADAVTGEAFAELADALGEACDEVELPGIFAEGYAWQRKIQLADAAKGYGPLVDRAPDQMSGVLREQVEKGRAITAVDYNLAREFQSILNGGLDEIFERYDAILTPAAAGPAPKGLQSTGSPIFCALWTYLGVPAVTLPLLTVDGLPLGVQLVGRRGDDGRLLRTARWLIEAVSVTGE